jgi:hypothetical protein
MLALFSLFALVAVAPPPDNLPTVVVYPFQASAALPRDVELRIVTVLSNQIALDGKVHVIPAEPDIERSAYLSSARKAGASFYITGFLTPLGDGASLIEQLVSTQSGTVVFSNSGQINTLGDVGAQGDILRSAIIGRSSLSYPDLGPGPGANAPEPPHANASEAPEANIGGLFHHRKPAVRASPSPSPAPAAVASPAP